MKILCINTAFKNAQITLEVDGKLYQKELDANAKSSEKVMPIIDEILFENNIKIGEIYYIGVVVGTGSFTGVRIGVSLVKGIMSCFENIKVVPINSLDLMAYVYSKNAKQDFFCIQNALSGRFFVAKYNKFGDSLNYYELTNELPENSAKVGLKIESLSECDVEIDITPKDLNCYAKTLIQKDNFCDINDLKPVYMRLSQAEENLLKIGDSNAKD